MGPVGSADDSTPVEVRDVPVTYAELRQAGIDLVTVTTNISQGTNETFPLGGQMWAFDPDGMRRLFPDEIVKYLV